jgi:DNA-binding transcriptional regulator YhcF (GntR family)
MISIDRDNGLPLYIQIKDQLLYEISISRLVAGMALPSIRQLAAQLQVTPATIRHAYAVLEAEGVVVSHQGKGVLVTDMDVSKRTERAPRQQELLELLSSALSHAFSLGYSSGEVKTAIAQVLAKREGLRKVLFVGSEPEFVEYYTPILGETLQDLGVDISAMHLSVLENNGLGVIDLFAPPLCVVTLVRSYAKVRQIFENTAISVVGLALQLSDATKEAIMTLPSDHRVVLVSERINLAGFHHMVNQYFAGDTPVVPVVAETRGLARAVADADIVLHSLRTRRTVSQLSFPDNTRVIELHFVPDPMSLSRVRQVVESQMQTKLKGATQREAETIADDNTDAERTVSRTPVLTGSGHSPSS